MSHVEFRTSPANYRHWRLAIEGPVATIAMDVDEQGGLVPGYELKLNSYDLGVDIELYDAVQRLRFEHPEVRAVVLTSGKEKIFCAGANIRMLAASAHSWKVNFCKFTNETRNGIEDASANSGQVYLAALAAAPNSVDCAPWTTTASAPRSKPTPACSPPSPSHESGPQRRLPDQPSFHGSMSSTPVSGVRRPAGQFVDDGGVEDDHRLKCAPRGSSPLRSGSSRQDLPETRTTYCIFVTFVI